VIGVAAVPAGNQGGSGQQQAAAGQNAGAQQQGAQIDVQQQAPQVTVQQPAPQVTVTQPEPQITVEQPQPQVTVQTPEPEVTVKTAQPQVDVQQQGQPQVEIEQAGQADVTVRQPDQAAAQDQQSAGGQSMAVADPAAAGVQDRLASMRVQELMDQTVYGANGEEVGDVENVLADRQGHASAIVVGVGGFLGIGERQVAIPLDRMSVGQDGRLTTELTRENIGSMQAYDAATYEEVPGNEQIGTTLNR
jgi:sporulation protein YlmC with PRC-barrel domain